MVSKPGPVLKEGVANAELPADLELNTGLGNHFTPCLESEGSELVIIFTSF